MIYSAPQSESIIIAALFYEPSVCKPVLDKIERAAFQTSYRAGLLSPCCHAIRHNGEVNPDTVVSQVSKAMNVDANRIFNDIIDCQQWHSFIHDTNSVEMAVDALAEIKRDIDKAKSIDILANELKASRIELDDARMVIDQIAEDHAAGGGSKLQTLNDTLATDPADEPVDILKTGLHWFDGALPNEGFQRGDKVVFSAPPGAGKTALALQLALNILDFNQSANVLWCLGEMTTKSLRNRALQCASGLSMDVLRSDWESLSVSETSLKHQALDQLRDLGNRFHFLPAPLTPRTIEDAIVQTKADFVAVDYLQLVRPDNGDKNSRREEVDAVVREFMRISQKHAPVLFLISDMAKGAEIGRNIFDAFKESSEIPFAADLAYVAEIVDERDNQGEWPEPLEMQLRCLKARHGRSNNIKVQFSRNTQRFAGSLQYV